VEQISDDIIKGEHECFVCKTKFSWIAIVKGKHNQDTIEKVYKINVFATAVAHKWSVWNNGKASGADLEIYVDCPECNCKNKLSSHIVTWKTDT